MTTLYRDWKFQLFIFKLRKYKSKKSDTYWIRYYRKRFLITGVNSNTES